MIQKIKYTNTKLNIFSFIYETRAPQESVLFVIIYLLFISNISRYQLYIYIFIHTQGIQNAREKTYLHESTHKMKTIRVDFVSLYIHKQQYIYTYHNKPCQHK